MKTEKNLLLSLENQEILLFKVKKKIFFSNLTVPLWRPPEGTVFHTIFSGKIFCVTRPQLSETAKNARGYRLWTPVCDNSKYFITIIYCPEFLTFFIVSMIRAIDLSLKWLQKNMILTKLTADNKIS